MKKVLTGKDILKKCNLTLPLEINSLKLYEKAEKHGFSRYKVRRYLLDITTTRGRTIAKSDEYRVKINEDGNDLVVQIDRIIKIK